MPELWETDDRAFLALTNLARRHTEYLKSGSRTTVYSEAFARARSYYPNLSDEDLLGVARQVEEHRNTSIMQVAAKVPPLRKIVSREFEGQTLLVNLECGHHGRLVPSKVVPSMVRCRACLKVENAEIAKNLVSSR